jgi:hypothetical protein
MKERKTVAMSFRFSPRLKRHLVAAAKHEHRSQANFLEQLVYDFCERYNVAPRRVAVRPKTAPRHVKK